MTTEDPVVIYLDTARGPAEAPSARTPWGRDPDVSRTTDVTTIPAIRADKLARAYRASRGLTPNLAGVLARAQRTPGATSGQLIERDPGCMPGGQIHRAPAQLVTLGYLRVEQHGQRKRHYVTRAGINALRGWELARYGAPAADQPPDSRPVLADRAEQLWSFRLTVGAQLVTVWDDMLELSHARIVEAWDSLAMPARRYLTRADLPSLVLIAGLAISPDWPYADAKALLEDTTLYLATGVVEQLDTLVTRRIGRMQAAGVVSSVPMPRHLRKDYGYWMLTLNPLFPAARGH